MTPLVRLETSLSRERFVAIRSVTRVQFVGRMRPLVRFQMMAGRKRSTATFFCASENHDNKRMTRVRHLCSFIQDHC